jgi:tetratricopeptide (TPR) repeat protein
MPAKSSRLLLIAIPVVLVAGAASAAGWYVLRPHDPLAEARQFMARGDLRSAELVLRSAVLANPAMAEAHLKLGQVQLGLGDPAAAERELRSARERGADPHVITPLLAQAVAGQGRNDEVLRDYAPDGLSPDQAAAVLVARAQAQLGLHQPDAARASIEQAQRLAPKSLDTALAAARLAIGRNDAVAASQHVTEALAIDPHSLEGLMMQAELRNAAGDRSAALASYGAALQQAQATHSDASAATIEVARANLRLAMDDNAGARSDVDAALKINPKNPLANFLSARLYVADTDWKAADAALFSVGPVLTRIPGGDMTLAVVKANVGEPEQAVTAAERQVARTPNALPAVKLLAKLEFLQKRPDLAVAALSATHAKLDAEALDMLGGGYASTGAGAKALDAMRQASALAPEDTSLLTRLARLELAQGQPGQATQTLTRALAQEPIASDASPVQPVSLQGTTAAPPTPADTAAALVHAALAAGEIDRAASALDRFRAAHGDPAELAMLDGLVKLAQVDLAGAQAAFETAVKLNPDATEPRISLGRVLGLEGHTDQAITAYKTVLASHPTDGQALTGLVNSLVATNQPDQAAAAAEAARQAAPTDVGITTGLASLYLRLNKPQQAIDAIDALQHKVAAQQSSPALLALRVQAQLMLGNRAEAERLLRARLDTTPDDVGLRRDVAEMLAADKNFDAARGLLRDGLARSPNNPALISASVGLAAAEGGPTAALARARELARDPANRLPPTFIGDLLMSQRQYSDAAAAYQAALKATPPDDPAAAQLQIRAASATASAGDSAGGIAALRAWLASHPGSSEASLALANLYIGAGHLPEARIQLEAVLGAQPNNPTALNNLAWVRQQQGDLDAARGLAERGYLLRPAPQSADTLGWIMLAQNQVPGAVAMLAEAARGGGQDPAIRYHWAAALAREGQKDAAISVLKPLAAAAPGSFADQAQATKLLGELSSH